MVKINGNNTDYEGMALIEFLEKENYDRNRIAIELNGDILPRANYADTVFKDGDVIEVVSFVGGG